MKEEANNNTVLAIVSMGILCLMGLYFLLNMPQEKKVKVEKKEKITVVKDENAFKKIEIQNTGILDLTIVAKNSLSEKGFDKEFVYVSSCEGSFFFHSRC